MNKFNMSDQQIEQFLCGPFCNNYEPCIAIREPNCDGQEDRVSWETIPDGQGWCLNGRCYNLDSIRRFRSDPVSRRSFQIRRENNADLREFIDATANNGRTALTYAARRGHTDAVRFLINAGANVNVRDNRGETALMYAAFSGHTDIARLLIQAGANVNATDTRGRTPLMAAALEGHTDIARLLIQAGANVNATDTRGQPVLAYAWQRRHTDVLRLLIQAGARRPGENDLVYQNRIKRRRFR